MTLMADSITQRWAAYRGHLKIQDLLSSLEACFHLNILTLKAVYLTCRIFLSLLWRSTIVVLIDNTIAMHYISRQEGERLCLCSVRRPFGSVVGAFWLRSNWWLSTFSTFRTPWQISSAGILRQPGRSVRLHPVEHCSQVWIPRNRLICLRPGTRSVRHFAPEGVQVQAPW